MTSGPIASTDNGDGSYTFEFDDGRPPLVAAGPTAAQYAQSLPPAAKQPEMDPSIVEAAQPGPDLRSAGPSFGLGGGAPMPGLGAAGGAPPDSVDTAVSQGQAQNEQLGGTLNKGEAPASGPMRRGTTEAGPAHIDPSQLTFGGGGSPRLVQVPGSKGGWQPTAMETREGFKPSEELQTGRQAAEGLHANALESGYAYGQQQAAAEIAAMKARSDMATRAMAEEQARQTQLNNQVSARMADLDKASDDLATRKINPNQYFEDKGAFGNIAMSIAASAGAFVAGRTGGTNQIMAQINQEVERNIAAQRANYDIAKDRVAGKRQSLSQLQQLGATQGEQAAALRTLSWKAIDSQIDVTKAQLGPAFNDQAYAQMKAEAQDKINQNRSAYEKEAQNQIATHSRYAPPTRGGVMAAPPDDIDPKAVAQLPGGQHVAFPTEESAKNFKESAAAVGEFKNKIAALKQVRSDPKAFVPGTDAYGRRQQLEAQVSLAAPKTLEGLARYTDLEKEMTEAGQHWWNKAGSLETLDAAANDKLTQAAHAHQGRAVRALPYRKSPTSGVTLGYQYQDFNTVPTAPPMTQRGE